MVGLDRLKLGELAAFSALGQANAAVTIKDDRLGRALGPGVDSDETGRLGDAKAL